MMDSNILPVINVSGESHARGLGVLAADLGARKFRLPLSRVEVSARVADRVAQIMVRQRFQNNYAEPINAIYIFPLADGSTVSRFELSAGNRTMVGLVHEPVQKQSLRINRNSQRAALLHQNHEDVFSAHLNGLPPGEEITVTVEYSERLPFFDDGTTELRLPVIVPSWQSGKPNSPEPSGEPEEIQDAAGWTTPTLAPTFDPQMSLSLAVELLPLLGSKSKTMQVINLCCTQTAMYTRTANGGTFVALSRAQAPLDRDFVLRWQLAEKVVRANLIAYKDKHDDACYGMLSLMSPLHVDQAHTPKDVLFIIDHSASMRGLKLTSAAKACSLLLNTLRPSDRYAIQIYDNTVEWMSIVTVSNPKEREQPLTQIYESRSVQTAQQYFFYADENGIDKGQAFLRTIEARGGTETSLALSDAFSKLNDRSDKEERAAIIVLITDNSISQESQVLQLASVLAHGKPANCRIFTVGLDLTNAQAAFLKRIANVGRGTASFVLPGPEMEQALINIGREIGTPYITDLAIEDLQAVVHFESLAPTRIPDLFVGQASTSFFKLSESTSTSTKIRLTGRFSDGTPYSEDVRASIVPLGAIGQLWAKNYLMELEDLFDTHIDKQESIKSEIVRIASNHLLFTPFTALAVIDVDEELLEEPDLARADMQDPSWTAYNNVVSQESYTTESMPTIPPDQQLTTQGAIEDSLSAPAQPIQSNRPSDPNFRESWAPSQSDPRSLSDPYPPSPYSQPHAPLSHSQPPSPLSHSQPPPSFRSPASQSISSSPTPVHHQSSSPIPKSDPSPTSSYVDSMSPSEQQSLSLREHSAPVSPRTQLENADTYTQRTEGSLSSASAQTPHDRPIPLEERSIFSHEPNSAAEAHPTPSSSEPNTTSPPNERAETPPSKPQSPPVFTKKPNPFQNLRKIVEDQREVQVQAQSASSSAPASASGPASASASTHSAQDQRKTIPPGTIIESNRQIPTSSSISVNSNQQILPQSLDAARTQKSSAMGPSRDTSAESPQSLEKSAKRPEQVNAEPSHIQPGAKVNQPGVGEFQCWEEEFTPAPLVSPQPQPHGVARFDYLRALDKLFCDELGVDELPKTNISSNIANSSNQPFPPYRANKYAIPERPSDWVDEIVHPMLHMRPDQVPGGSGGLSFPQPAHTQSETPTPTAPLDLIQQPDRQQGRPWDASSFAGIDPEPIPTPDPSQASGMSNHSAFANWFSDRSQLINDTIGGDKTQSHNQHHQQHHHAAPDLQAWEIRAQVLDTIVRQAIAGSPWRQTCAAQMELHKITTDEVEHELVRRMMPRSAFSERANTPDGFSVLDASSNADHTEKLSQLRQAFIKFSMVMAAVDTANRPSPDSFDASRSELLQVLADPSLQVYAQPPAMGLQRFLRTDALVLYNALKSGATDISMVLSSAQQGFAKTHEEVEKLFDKSQRPSWGP